MRLSTSTNIMEDVEKVFDVISVEECIEACAKVGYKYIDMNLAGQGRPGMPLTQDGWIEWAKRIRALGDGLGVEFKQSHCYFYNSGDLAIADREYHEELVRRSFIASGILGVEWMVMHPANIKDEIWYSYEKSLAFNLEYHAPYIKLAKEHGVGIALENLNEFGRNRRYCASPDELIELVDTINDPSVGICWDFGHGHIAGVNQVEALRKIGTRLKATHVADNHGASDEHLAPYYGHIDWKAMVGVLKEIGYQGDFAFEIQSFTDVLPINLRDDILNFTYKLGVHLLSLGEGE